MKIVWGKPKRGKQRSTVWLAKAFDTSALQYTDHALSRDKVSLGTRPSHAEEEEGLH